MYRLVDVILLPVYQPGERLPAFAAELLATGAAVVVVDDGSTGAGPAAAIDAARAHGCVVLRHPGNRGKGVAIKTGFRHIAEAYPDAPVTCADADGQHRVADVRRVAARLRPGGPIVLGVRGFEGRVPLRSRTGNTLSRLLFEAATGVAVRDTQTGLRGYPAELLGWLGAVPGERFEYEMNVLLHAARAGHRIEQVRITTTYAPGNPSSHFGSLTDSARVYRPLLRAAVQNARR